MEAHSHGLLGCHVIADERGTLPPVIEDAHGVFRHCRRVRRVAPLPMRPVCCVIAERTIASLRLPVGAGNLRDDR